MSHAGFSPCPDDSCPDSKNAPGSASQHLRPTSRGVNQGEALIANEPATNLPIQTARADAAASSDSLPFVVQAGQILFLVAEEAGDWVVAELRFDPVSCTFAEERRTRFQWPREAFGRLLSRTVIGDEFDMDEANRVADAFTRWLASQFVTSGNAR